MSRTVTRSINITVGILLVVTLLIIGATKDSWATGQGSKKVTICHATSSEKNPFVTLTISENAVYKKNGGHFYENGTTQAGHEEDYFGPCLTDATPKPCKTEKPDAVRTPSPTPNPTVEPTSEPTATPTQEPTPEPTPKATPVPTTTPTNRPTAQPTDIPGPEATPVVTPYPTDSPERTPTLELPPTDMGDYRC
jgi:outer membrane biosynthesis protein TonB